MSRAYSQDLRDRVIDATLKEALSARSAAARFGVGIATAIVWVRRARETGSRMKVPSRRRDLSNTGVCGSIPRSCTSQDTDRGDG